MGARPDAQVCGKQRNIPLDTAQFEGHREFTFEGAPGVLIPAAEETKIQFDDNIALALSLQAGSIEDNTHGIQHIHV